MIRKNRLIYFFLMMLLISCNTGNKKTSEKVESITEQTASRPDSFENDSVMLDYIQKVHFNYMWDGAEKTSGLALERIHLDNNYPQNDEGTVTIGGSGFGIAGILTAIHRQFITREEGVERLTKIVDYLAKADRFHGVWPHWLEGSTGKVLPFSKKDDGGDLVESCFVIQSLLCVRQYFQNGNEKERQLCEKINKIWHEVEFDWYQNGKDVIYWHWSPNYGWEMNFPLEGYNEALIVYVLAASSPTHPVSATAYHNGWARGGNIKSDSKPYGYPLEVKHNGAEKLGGPLFWAHYSYIGLNPKGLSDCNETSCAFDGIAYNPSETGERDMLVVQAGEYEGIFMADLPIDKLREYRSTEVLGNAYHHPDKYGLLVEERIEAPFVRDDYRP